MNDLKLIKIVEPGQLTEGDLILINTKNGTAFPVTVKKVIGYGSNMEEIVYSTGKNFYYITSMIIDGTSCYVDSVYIVPNGQLTVLANNFKSHF